MKKITLSTISILMLCSSLFSYSYHPYQTENGVLYNFDNDGDGYREATYVTGYYKSDGTYVRSHYRK